jgi:hypothetical protein
MEGRIAGWAARLESGIAEEYTAHSLFSRSATPPVGRQQAMSSSCMPGDMGTLQ